MSDGFAFWTHGVAIIPEYTKEYTGDDRGLRLVRQGYGAKVYQKTGTDNWFHFAIPTPTELDDDTVSYQHAWVRFQINTSAVVRKITVHQGQTKLVEKSYSETGVNKELKIELPDAQCTGPLVVCVNVFFEADGGEVIFFGAGAQFLEAT